MFARLPDTIGDPVEITIDGEPFVARSIDSVAAALLASGRLVARGATVSDEPRGPSCMMGVCFDCLVTIDGHASQQSCLVQVAPGMRVETRAGRPKLGDRA